MNIEDKKTEDRTGNTLATSLPAGDGDESRNYGNEFGVGTGETSEYARSG